MLPGGGVAFAGAVGGPAQGHAEALGRAGGEGVAQRQVAFPVLGVLAIGVVEVAVARAVRVDPGQVGLATAVGGAELPVRGGEEGQAGLVLDLPRALAGAVEVGVLHGVAFVEEGPVVLRDEVERGVAIDLLQAEAQRLAAAGQGQPGVVEVVVDPAELAAALVAGLVVMQPGRQGQLAGKPPRLAEAEVVLVPDIRQAAAVERRLAAAGGAVAGAQPGDVRAFAIGGDTALGAVAVAAGEMTVAALVAQAGGFDEAGVQFERAEMVVLQGHATVALRHHATDAAGDHRVLQQLVADLQQAVQAAQLEGRAGRREAVGGATGGVQRQHAGTAAAATAVQAQAVEGVRIQADAYRRVGIAGAERQHQALGPFALVAAGRGVVVVAGEIVVADETVQRRAFDEARRHLHFGFLPLVQAGADVVAMAQGVVGQERARTYGKGKAERSPALHGGIRHGSGP